MKRRKVKSFIRRSRSRVASFGRRTTRRSRGSSGGVMGGLINPTAMAYGALRNPVVNVVMPYTSALDFLGQYKDEAIALGINYVMTKTGNGTLSNAGRIGMIVENANIGATASQGFNLGGASTGSSNW